MIDITYSALILFDRDIFSIVFLFIFTLKLAQYSSAYTRVYYTSWTVWYVCWAKGICRYWKEYKL